MTSSVAPCPDPAQRFNCAVCQRESAGPVLKLPVPAPAEMPRMRLVACGACRDDWPRSAHVAVAAAARLVRQRVARILGLPVEAFDDADGLDGAAAAAGLPRARVDAAMLEAMGCTAL